MALNEGILRIDKPQGLTSHDVVQQVRRSLGIKRAGHAGTLDPIATGLLIILVGGATKYFSRFSGDDKVYEVVLVLGETRDTGDAWGNVTGTSPVLLPPAHRVKKTLKAFEGSREQIPPMYSAVKHKGTPLYKLARKGLTVPRRPRTVHIRRVTVASVLLPEVSCTIHCSKGTYVRQLCVDLGEVLRCGAYMKRLRRIRSGALTLDGSLTFDRLRSMSPANIRARITPVANYDDSFV